MYYSACKYHVNVHCIHIVRNWISCLILGTFFGLVILYDRHLALCWVCTGGKKDFFCAKHVSFLMNTRGQNCIIYYFFPNANLTKCVVSPWFCTLITIDLFSLAIDSNHEAQSLQFRWNVERWNVL